MNHIFNYENGFWTFMNKLADAVIASLLWVVFSLPVITFGTSTTAFYYTVHKSLRGDCGYVWKSFWKSFKSNIKQTTKIWAVMMAVFAILFGDLRIMHMFLKQGSSFGMLSYIFYGLLFLCAIWCIYIFSYSARFENGMKATMKNAGMIALLNLPWSFLMLVLLIIGACVVYILPPVLILVPAVVMYVYNIFLEKIFRKYMSEEDLKKEEAL